jgi:hypothetical protein
MSTSAVSSSSLSQQLQQYIQTRQSDLQQLGQALGQGNLNAAQSAFQNIVSLGQNGPFPNGEPFAISQREQDFNAVGQALQNGDLAGAQQAFSQLRSTFGPQQSNTGPNNNEVGPEIVLNLSGTGAGAANPEPITINVNAASGGGEQVSLSIGNQGSNPQELTFNFGPNSNEPIVLNLGAAGSSSADNGLSVSA